MSPSIDTAVVDGRRRVARGMGIGGVGSNRRTAARTCVGRGGGWRLRGIVALRPSGSEQGALSSVRSDKTKLGLLKLSCPLSFAGPRGFSTETGRTGPGIMRGDKNGVGL